MRDIGPSTGSARAAVARAIKTGRMPLPETLACGSCGKPAADYHHCAGYTREHWLTVEPLCRSCHAWKHANCFSLTAGAYASMTINMRPDLRNGLERLSRETGVSITRLTNDAVGSYLWDRLGEEAFVEYVQYQSQASGLAPRGEN